MDVQRFSAFRF